MTILERYRTVLKNLLEHEGERERNGIGMELDSNELEKAKEEAERLLADDPCNEDNLG